MLTGGSSADVSVPFRSKNVQIKEIDEFDFSKVQLTFFAVGTAVTLSFAPSAEVGACSMIDLSGTFLGRPDA